MTTMWSAGEPARAAGVTMRTPHHYDEIDLLVPSERTATGHRRYTADDVRRLYRIRGLRHPGVPLDRISPRRSTPVTCASCSPPNRPTSTPAPGT